MRSAAAVSAASLANLESSLTDPNRFFACSDACAKIIIILCIYNIHMYIYIHTHIYIKIYIQTHTHICIYIKIKHILLS